MQRLAQSSQYYRNLAFSTILATGLLATGFTFLFIILFFVRILEPIAETPKKEEKRYTVSLRDEQKPKEPPRFAENINENNLRPKDNAFLSNKTSLSTDKTLSENKTREVVAEQTDYASLELKKGSKNTEEKEKNEKRQLLNRRFDSSSIFGQKEKGLEKKKESGNNGNSQISKFSSSSRRTGAERIGSEISLSTYAWEYAPYIQMMKERMYKYISPPPAYYLGLLKGKSRAKLVISRNGELLEFKILGHYGSKPLQKTTEDMMLAIFKLPPLPPNFPEETLTMTWAVHY